MSSTVQLLPIVGMPDVMPGDDVAALLLTALAGAGQALRAGDVLVVAQKIISKAEDRYVYLDDVEIDAQARDVAARTGKDPRLVALILRESDAISRMAPGVLIVRHKLGFTSANAGIDRSNIAGDPRGERVLLLPADPDAGAARLRVALAATTDVDVAVIISDSHGRPFRLGTVNVAIGVAGLLALWDRRGERDLYGYALQHTEVALADEIAAAAGLLMGQAAEGVPAVIVRGLPVPAGDGRAVDLIRPLERDLYR